jgi:hypothetical protein
MTVELPCGGIFWVFGIIAALRQGWGFWASLVWPYWLAVYLVKLIS